MAAKEPLCGAVSMIRTLRAPQVRIDTTDRNGSEEAVMVYHADDVRMLAGPPALPWKLWSLRRRSRCGRHVDAIRELAAAAFPPSPWVLLPTSWVRKVVQQLQGSHLMSPGHKQALAVFLPSSLSFLL